MRRDSILILIVKDWSGRKEVEWKVPISDIEGIKRAFKIIAEKYGLDTEEFTW